MIAYKQLILIYFSGFAFTATPGKAGELIRGAYLLHYKVPFRFSLCAFVSERLLDIFAVSLLSSYFAVQTLHPASGLLTVCLCGLPFLVSTSVLRLQSYCHKKTLCDLLGLISQFWQIKLVMRNMFLSVMAWSAQGWILFLILRDLGSSIDVQMAISIYCLSLLVGAASLIPSGIGVTEIGMIFLLQQQGVIEADAMVAAVTSRMLTLWPAIIFGLLTSFILRYQPQAEHSHGSS